MGAHLIGEEFQSDKFPSTPRGKVPLSTKDPAAQDLLWEYAQRRRSVDAEFSDDLEAALRLKGYTPPPAPISLQAESNHLRDVNQAWAKLLFAEQNGGQRAYEAAAQGLQDLGVDPDALMGAL